MRTLLKTLKRIWDVAVGLVMIVLSIGVQLIFFVLLTWGVVGLLSLIGIEIKSNFGYNVICGALALLFNVLACFEYFRRRRVAVLGGGVHSFKALVQPDAGHVSFAIFLVPRGIDRIVTGRERTDALANSTQTEAGESPEVTQSYR